ncbi:hypothetical protein [Mesorhizobium sp. KR1-2]
MVDGTFQPQTLEGRSGMALVKPLKQDRPLGADAEALYAALSSGKWQA